MGLFGGGNSSSSNTTVTNDINRTIANYAQVDGAQSNLTTDISGNDNTISMLDGGAISGAFDFSKAGLQTIESTLKESMAQMGAADQRSKEVTLQTLNTNASLANPDKSTSGDIIKYGAIALAIVVIVIVVAKKGA